MQDTIQNLIRSIRKDISDSITDIDTYLTSVNGYLNHSSNVHQQKASTSEATKNQASQPVSAPEVECLLTASDKIHLVSSLFSGRTDRFANRYITKDGKKGYSPACSNLWRRGVCPKVNNPKFNCGACTNRSLTTLTDEVIKSHLRGESHIGIYPLLENNRVNFLAMDFDKENWRTDVLSAWQACEELEIDCLVEISQSGNGAHLWIFFSSPVAAYNARKLGVRILSKAMESNVMMPLESFDRLFPSQDTLPFGDFGNLIALPLNYELVKQGRAVFVDSSLNPLEDQWGALQSVRRISPEELISDFGIDQFKDRKITVDEDDGTQREEYAPWDVFLPIPTHKVTNLNISLDLVLRNQLYIPDSAPNTFLAAVKRLASLANPEFFKARNANRATYNIPRYICFMESHKGFVSVPRGLVDKVKELAKNYGIKLSIEDKTYRGGYLPKSFMFTGELREDQIEASKAILPYNYAMLKGATAFGKTILSLHTIHKRRVKTLILVDTSKLAKQWVEKMQKFLTGIEIGYKYGRFDKLSGLVDVCTYQSIVKRGTHEIAPFIHKYGQIIIDEAHKAGSATYTELLESIAPRYILAVTATPKRYDGLEQIVFMQTGEIRYIAKESQEVTHDKYLVCQETHCLPTLELSNKPELHMADVYNELMNNSQRNELIIGDIVGAVRAGRNPIVLTQRKEHARLLVGELNKRGLTTSLQIGTMKAKELRQEEEKLETAQVIVGTGRYIGDGFDMPRLDTLFVVLPVSWNGLSEQYGGRLNRTDDNKENIVVVDYVDSSFPMVGKMLTKRKTGYNRLKFKLIDVGEHPCIWDCLMMQ